MKSAKYEQILVSKGIIIPLIMFGYAINKFYCASILYHINIFRTNKLKVIVVFGSYLISIRAILSLFSPIVIVQKIVH